MPSTNESISKDILNTLPLIPSPQGRGNNRYPLPWRERARVRGCGFTYELLSRSPFISLATPYIIFVLVAFSLSLIMGACAGTQYTNRDAFLTTQEQGPVWPQPPQKPRIQSLGSISGPSDLGIKRSWVKKTIDALFGKEEIGIVMLRPYGVFVDAGRIYVTDPGGSALHIFDMTNKEYMQIKKFRGGMLLSPIGVAVDKDAIYITDSVLKKLVVFDKRGNFLREIGDPEIFIRPTGIAVEENRIYVIDTHGNKVLVFAKKDGKLLFHFGKNGVGNGEFNYPTHIFIGKDRLLYITDSLNFRIQIFDPEGKFLSTLGKHGDGSGDLSKPKGIAVDSEGHIYVADADFDNVQVFDRTGNLLLVFGNTGRKRGEMTLPAGVFIDGQDRIYVADSYNNRIQVFRYLRETN